MKNNETKVTDEIKTEVQRRWGVHPSRQCLFVDPEEEVPFCDHDRAIIQKLP